MTGGREIVSLIGQRQDLDQFRKKNWEGTFDQYLDVVTQDARVTRNAFQRVYDMITSYGAEPFTQFKQEYTRYKFFGDPVDGGADAIYGLERPLMTLCIEHRVPDGAHQRSGGRYRHGRNRTSPTALVRSTRESIHNPSMLHRPATHWRRSDRLCRSPGSPRRRCSRYQVHA